MASVDTLMLLANGFEPDPRVHKEARSLLRAGYRPTLVCLDRRCNLPAEEQVDGLRLLRIRVGQVRAGDPRSLMRALPLFYAQAVRAARRLHARAPFALVHCHDLDTMVPGVTLQRMLSIPLVYDIHDLYASFFAAPALQRAVNAIDERMRRAADGLVIVNERFLQFPGIDRQRTVVVMNVPSAEGSGTGSGTDSGLFYAGNLDHHRDMRYALPVLRASGFPVEFAGDGPLVETYRTMVPDGSVRLLGRISPAEVFERTARCKAVLALYDTRIENNRLASPNKLFDAMKYGKPSIVSADSVMGEIVRRHDCGVAVPYGDAEALAAALRQLHDPARYATMCTNALAAFRQHYSWEAMEPRLWGLYAQLIGTR
jgi:glycosyltransferase involved in cell wall biosynthesis